MSSKRYCAKCGEEIPEGASFCVRCGTRISKQTITAQIATPQRQSTGRRSGVVLAAILVVVVLVASIVASVLYRPYNPPEMSTSTAVSFTSSSSELQTANQEKHGYMKRNEVWRGEISVIGDIVVGEEVTLTIEPGTIVRIAANYDVENLRDYPFDLKQGISPEDDFVHGVHRGEPYRDENNHISIEVLGTLNAVGTPERMITITSSSPNPSIYDWNRLEFAHGILSYAIVEYYRLLGPGDGTEVSHNILRHIGECGVCANGSLTVEHNEISFAGHELIDMHHSSPVVRGNHLGPNPDHAGIIDGGSPQILNNVIEGCGVGIHFISPQDNPIIRDNTFLNNGQDIVPQY